MRAHADSAIAQFGVDLAARKAALRRESKYKKGEALVNEDGFTLVIRGGAYSQAVGGDALQAESSRTIMPRVYIERRVGASGRDIMKGRRRLRSMPSRFTRRSRMVRISPVITVQLALTGANSLTETKVGGRLGGRRETQGVENIYAVLVT